jgi:quercetin dioxygenase-like cupin family protein
MIRTVFIDTDELEAREPRPGWRGRFFHSASMTFGYWEVAAGSWVHEHSHPNEEVWNIIEGEFEITVDGVTQLAGAGCAVVVPADTRHGVRALTEGRAIVVDHPLRAEIGGVRTD